MAKRLTLLLAALLVLGFVVAGCGDDENGDNNPAADTPAETATTDEATTEEPATDKADTGADKKKSEGRQDDDSKGAGEAKPPKRKVIGKPVNDCDKSIPDESPLSDETREDLRELCEKARSGDPDDIRDVGRDLCRQVVEQSYPEGAKGRDQALEACEG